MMRGFRHDRYSDVIDKSSQFTLLYTYIILFEDTFLKLVHYEEMKATWRVMWYARVQMDQSVVTKIRESTVLENSDL